MRLERLQLFGEQFALSWAVTSGDVIHVTGMTGMIVDFDEPSIASFTYPDGVEAQMRQCYRNIEWILHRAGASLFDIADQTVFFRGDADVFAAANRIVRGELFGNRPPASALVGVSQLHHPDCLLEIKSIAYRGAG
jgi:enamine deaminase RidA (YjgF/YER057c/UK114 family)